VEALAATDDKKKKNILSLEKCCDTDRRVDVKKSTRQLMPTWIPTEESDPDDDDTSK
jgi:hypothetical protein